MKYFYLRYERTGSRIARRMVKFTVFKGICLWPLRNNQDLTMLSMSQLPH